MAVPHHITMTTQWASWCLKSPLDGLFNHLCELASNKTSKSALPVLCEGNPPVTGGFPHKGPITWKAFPLRDVIMVSHPPDSLLANIGGSYTTPELSPSAVSVEILNLYCCPSTKSGTVYRVDVGGRAAILVHSKLGSWRSMTKDLMSLTVDIGGGIHASVTLSRRTAVLRTLVGGSARVKSIGKSMGCYQLNKYNNQIRHLSVSSLKKNKYEWYKTHLDHSLGLTCTQQRGKRLCISLHI